MTRPLAKGTLKALIITLRVATIAVFMLHLLPIDVNACGGFVLGDSLGYPTRPTAFGQAQQRGK